MAAAVRAHRCDRRSRAVDDAEQVDAHDALDELVGLGGGVARAEDAGVVDPHARAQLVGQRSAGGGVGDVEQSIGAGEVDAHDVEPLALEPVDQGTTEAARSTGDDGGSPGSRARGYPISTFWPLPTTMIPPSLTV